MSTEWEYKSRPKPANARFVDLDRIDPSDYDLCLLHFDENSLAPENCAGVISPDWGLLFQHLRRTAKIPTIAVCHGTPQFYGQYDHKLERPDLERFEAIEEERRKLVDFLSDALVICNSHQAAAEWQFKRSKVIWHGFDPADYPPARRRKKILTVAGRIKVRPHYRGFYLYEKVTRGLPCDIVSGDMPNDVVVREPSRHCRTMTEYAQLWFRSYVDLVREYSIFFNPTLRSPMPRSRAEAMLCGLALVNAKNHDVERFIENGKNGFYATEVDELRDQLRYLVSHPDEARKIGEAGRATAMRVFHIDRYLAEWHATIAEVLR